MLNGVNVRARKCCFRESNCYSFLVLLGDFLEMIKYYNTFILLAYQIDRPNK